MKLMNYRYLLSILLLTFCFSVSNKTFCQGSLFSRQTYKNAAGDSLQYRFLFPDNDSTRRYTLVVFLHGSGERGNDNEAQLKWGVMNFATDYNMKTHPAFVIAPQCPLNNSWANGGDISKASVIAHIPLWIFGGADDPSVNPNLLYNMVNALLKTGTHPGFTQYPGVGHFSWIAAYSDPMMIEWLFNQHK
jgi:predicted peptidase